MKLYTEEQIKSIYSGSESELARTTDNATPHF